MFAFFKDFIDVEIYNRKDFYETLYFHELDFREKLESGLKFSMTAFATLIAMALFYLMTIKIKDKRNQLYICFDLCCRLFNALIVNILLY